MRSSPEEPCSSQHDPESDNWIRQREDESGDFSLRSREQENIGWLRDEYGPGQALADNSREQG